MGNYIDDLENVLAIAVQEGEKRTKISFASNLAPICISFLSEHQDKHTLSVHHKALLAHMASTPSLADKIGIKSLVKNSLGHVCLICALR
jgi:hypothetical protein